MSGTSAGAKKALKTIQDRYGVDENGKSLLYSTAGRKGGQAKNSKKGLGGLSKKRRREIAKMGGKRSGEVRRNEQ